MTACTAACTIDDCPCPADADHRGGHNLAGQWRLRIQSYAAIAGAGGIFPYCAHWDIAGNGRCPYCRGEDVGGLHTSPVRCRWCDHPIDETDCLCGDPFGGGPDKDKAELDAWDCDYKARGEAEIMDRERNLWHNFDRKGWQNCLYHWRERRWLSGMIHDWHNGLRIAPWRSAEGVHCPKAWAVRLRCLRRRAAQ